MKFGLVHRVMTNALAALGVLSLVATGELGRWVNVAILVGLACAVAVPERFGDNPWVRRGSQIAPLLFLSIQIGRWVSGRPLLEVAVEFAAVLQIVRVATRSDSAHDQQVIVLALLHLIAGTVLGGGLAYGVCFLGFLVVAPAALVLSHLRREVEGNYRQGARDRTGLPVDVPRILKSRRVVGKTFLLVTCSLALPILLFTAGLFTLFPRVGFHWLIVHQEGGRRVGFSDLVDLGSVGLLRDDPQIALRVTLPDLPEPPPDRVALHLRGTALDFYDGRAWARTNVHRAAVGQLQQIIPIERRPEPDDQRVTIDLEAFDPPVLFTPPGAVAVEIVPRTESPFLLGVSRLRIERGAEGELRYRDSEERGVRYHAWVSRRARTSAAREDMSRYLQLPQGLSPRISALAAEWVGASPQPLEKARIIERRLRAEYRYDRASPSAGTPHPLDHFLFESRRGHCEFYSTAMAIMLRTAGVPTRNVTGFAGGSWNRFSRAYTVRQGDAHSWVEVWIDGVGWQLFDPTPPAEAAPQSELRGLTAFLRDMLEATSQRWDRNVVGYDIHQQMSLLERLRGSFRAPAGRPAFGVPPSTLFLSVVGLVVVWWLVRRLLRRRRALASPEEARSTPAVRARIATALYEALEGAMSAQGVPRAQGVPPLAHARSSDVTAHPLAREILDLTELYLDARFGHRALDAAERDAFLLRVKRVRAHKIRPARA
ncbi:MAG: DUF3488 domain-containing protein [Polyangiaceae bacterium]|nr:DUF3488 domain-containing protein [Polyangiaceae bacterium]